MTIRAFNSRGGFSIQDPPIQVINNVGNYNGGTGTFSGAVTASSFIGSIAASSITGTTLASNVVLSSLTSLGTITSGVWNATAIGATKGGTGQTTYATGDLIYSSASNTLSKLGKPAATSVLSMTSGGIPSWNGITGTGSTVFGTSPSISTLEISTTTSGNDKSAVINMATGVTANEFVSSTITLNAYSSDFSNLPAVPFTKTGYISTTPEYDLNLGNFAGTLIAIDSTVIYIGDIDANNDGTKITVDSGGSTVDITGTLTTNSTASFGDAITIGTGFGLVDSKSVLMTLTTANQLICSISKTAYRSAEFFVQASTAGGAYEALKIVAVHDGTTTYNTQYGVIRSGANLGTYTTIIGGGGGGQLRLRVTPTTVNTTYKVMITALPV